MMTRNRGQAAVSMTNACDAAKPAGAPATQRANTIPGRPRVADRWMAELIRFASGCPLQAETPPPHPQDPAPLDPPVQLEDRLRQAIRWGYQEREFSRFEASLARQATLGELIAWARQRQGRSLHEVSEHAGLSEGLLRDLEKGGLSPLEVAPEKMARLARTLDVSIWTMLERVPPAAVPANGASSPHERILPDAAAPAADAIWSAGARHRKPRSETVALKEPAPAPRAQKQAADYRAALRKAWHRHDQEPPTE